MNGNGQANGHSRIGIARRNGQAIAGFYASVAAAGDKIDQAFARQMKNPAGVDQRGVVLSVFSLAVTLLVSAAGSVR